MRIPICLAALTLFAFCVAAPLSAEDAADNAADNAAMEAAVAKIAITSDPVFSQFVDLNELDYAWTYLDAEALADIGMKLAEAERVLFRSHDAITSKDVLKIAVRTASVKGATETLKKLQAFAEKTDRGEMVQEIKLASQLAGKSRSVAPSLSLDDVSLGAFIAYKQSQHDLNAALVYGDVKMLEELQGRVNKWNEKEPAIWNKLSGEINEQVKNLKALGAPSRGGPDDMSGATEALDKLSGGSRQWPGYGGPPGYGYGSGGNFGSQSISNFQYQQGVRVQDPGAAVLGGLFSGIAGGLNAKNPQKNAVAAGILQGLGQGFTIGSQPTYFGSGSIQQQQQGYNNNWGQGYGN